MKKILFRAVIGVCILFIAIAIVGFLSLNSLVKKGVETMGPRLTKTEVTLGGAYLSPFSGRGRLNGLFIGNPKGFKTPSAFKLREIRVDIETLSVFSDVVVIEEIKVISPEITYERGSEGTNLGKILSNIEGEAQGNKKRASPGKKRRFAFKNVLIKDGKINVGAAQLNDKTLSVDLKDIHLKNIGTPEKGVTMEEFSKIVMEAVLSNSAVSLDGVASDVERGLKEAGKGLKDQLDRMGKGIKNLFQ